jgi:hypothetical protein
VARDWVGIGFGKLSVTRQVEEILREGKPGLFTESDPEVLLRGEIKIVYT